MIFKHNNCRYYVQNGNLIPSVTTILDKTSNKFYLDKWRKSMTEEAYEAYMQRCINRGDAFHKSVEAYLLRNEVTDNTELHKTLPWLSDVSPKLIEQQFINTDIGYAGTCDIIASKGDELFVADWKTSTKHKTKSALGDYPLQLAAYWHEAEKILGKINIGYILVISDVKDSVYPIKFTREELQTKFDAFRLRLDKFYSSYEPLNLSTLVMT